MTALAVATATVGVRLDGRARYCPATAIATATATATAVPAIGVAFSGCGLVFVLTQPHPASTQPYELLEDCVLNGSGNCVSFHFWACSRSLASTSLAPQCCLLNGAVSTWYWDCRFALPTDWSYTQSCKY